MMKFIALLWALWRYNTKDSLFAYIRRNLSDQSDDWIDKFVDIYERMETDFAGICRQSGALYITHLHAVVVIIVVHLKIVDINAVLAALCHDAIEDLPHEWNYKRLRDRHNDILAQYVVALSKPFCGPYDEYHRSFMVTAWLIAVIKLADRTHNVLTLFYCSLEHQQRKIAETITFYLPVSIEREILNPELHCAVKFAQYMATFAGVWRMVMLKTKPKAV